MENHLHSTLHFNTSLSGYEIVLFVLWLYQYRRGEFDWILEFRKKGSSSVRCIMLRVELSAGANGAGGSWGERSCP